MPAGGEAGEITVVARLLYRKIDQYLLNFMFGEKAGLTSPVTEMARAEARLRVGAPPRGDRGPRPRADGGAAVSGAPPPRPASPHRRRARLSMAAGALAFAGLTAAARPHPPAQGALRAGPRGRDGAPRSRARSTGSGRRRSVPAEPRPAATAAAARGAGERGRLPLRAPARGEVVFSDVAEAVGPALHPLPRAALRPSFPRTWARGSRGATTTGTATPTSSWSTSRDR